MAALRLSPHDQALLDGGAGEAAQLAMRIVTRMGRALGAERLRDITAAHIDGCLYHGQAGLDFAQRLADLDGRVVVPTTLNVGSLDLLHPWLFRGDPATGQAARALMDAYVALGCQPTWTCAPYQLDERPAFGQQIAWAESNAIVFANSVLGARTERYGDFMDICAALTGRVPDIGLHRDAGRRGQVVFELDDLPEQLRAEDVFYPVLGHLIGHATGNLIPVIVGLPSTTTEDQLKALGAASASSGSVALFHAVGVTPEAPTLADALQGAPPERVVRVTRADLRAARDSLSTATEGRLATVSLGTPHFSLNEFEQLVPLLVGQRVHADVECYVSTGRAVRDELAARGWLAQLEKAGVRIVVDTCTYITPILRKTPRDGVAMTNSGKWAYYAPGNLGVAVVFGSLRECAQSAIRGAVWRDAELWADV
jgi:predicted aconitase